MLGLDRPEAALDEARTRALANARARAELYARALGMRVKRILSVSETGRRRRRRCRWRGCMADQDSATQIAPGEQTLSVSLTVSFELE